MVVGVVVASFAGSRAVSFFSLCLLSFVFLFLSAGSDPASVSTSGTASSVASSSCGLLLLRVFWRFLWSPLAFSGVALGAFFSMTVSHRSARFAGFTSSVFDLPLFRLRFLWILTGAGVWSVEVVEAVGGFTVAVGGERVWVFKLVDETDQPGTANMMSVEDQGGIMEIVGGGGVEVEVTVEVGFV